PPPSPPLYTLSLHDALPISGRSPSTTSSLFPLRISTRTRISPSKAIDSWRTSLKVDARSGSCRHILNSSPLSATDCCSSSIPHRDRKSTRLNSSHDQISYAV